MRAAGWISVLCLLSAAAVAGAGGRNDLVPVAGIRRYYELLNRVATTSTPEEQAAALASIQGRGTASRGWRLGGLRRSIFEILSFELEFDPGMVRGPRRRPDLCWEVTPVRVLRRTADTLVIETRRTPHRPAGMVTPVGPGASRRTGILNPGPASPWVLTEIHYWLLVGGRWKLDSLHIYRIG